MQATGILMSSVVEPYLWLYVLEEPEGCGLVLREGRCTNRKGLASFEVLRTELETIQFFCM
jgi:hypothetical protein